MVVISYNTWLKDFNKTPDILTKKITFSSTSFNIIGVLSQRFIEPDIYETGRETEVWLPWDYNTRNHLIDRMYSFPWFVFIGQLKNDISIAQAEHSITPLVNDHWQKQNKGNDFVKDWQVNMQLLSFNRAILGDNHTTIWLLLGGVFGLLIIACSNMTNLFLARTAEQQKQLAVHYAIGAKKSNLYQLILAETSLLMSLAAALAFVIVF